MEQTRKPTSHIAPFGLRMQEDLRKQLEESAAESGRSLNAEIVHRLQASFEIGDNKTLHLHLPETATMGDVNHIIYRIKTEFGDKIGHDSFTVTLHPVSK